MSSDLHHSAHSAPLPPLWLRLVRVETRKLVDTQAARGVLLSVAGLSLALMVAMVLLRRGSPEPLTYDHTLGGLGLFLTLAVSLIGILGMTGDWAHRVTTTYFPLVSSRTPIYLAKVAATLVVALGLLAVLVVASVVALVVAGAAGLVTQHSGLGDNLALVTVTTLLGTFFGAGIAAVVRRFTLALVLVLLLTLSVNTAVFLLVPESLHGVLSTLTPLALMPTDDPVASDLGPGPAGWEIAGSLLLWYVGPLVLGWVIARRAEA